MLHPSYSDLMDAVHSNVEDGEEPVVKSRYSIVKASSKRQRKLVDGAEPLVASKEFKPLSTAIEEIYSQKVKIEPSDTKK